MDAGQLATQGMLALHDYWKSLPENMRTQEMLKSRGFDTMGFSLVSGMRNLQQELRERISEQPQSRQ
jgi:hypothetical protein